MSRTRKNIFVLGADEFNLSQMRALDKNNEYCFHHLFQHEEVKAGPEIPAKKLYEGALQKLKTFAGTIDAIVGYWDFPVSTMLPLLREPYDLPSPSFESTLKCEHKYWSRLEQSRVIPEHIPEYCAVNPFDENYQEQVTVDYPFWIKPVKAASSHLAFKVHNDAELGSVIRVIRENIFRFSGPFNYLLQFIDMPDDVAEINGNYCIVESIISRGRQCTLEGYVYNGEVQVYGVVDSIREGKHRSSFARYQYPSTIPVSIQERMISLTERFLHYIDFDNGPFNIEYYWEKNGNKLWLLEINTRISKSHCPLFRHVDGESHHKVMLDLALGRKPDFPHRKGSDRLAAKFMWREYQDAVVRKVPDNKELDAICKAFPGVEIQLHIHEGMRLSALKDQDSYSYEIAVIFLGDVSQKKILQKYREVQKAMGIRLDPL